MGRIMIKITQPQKKSAGWIVWAVAGSFLVHGGLFYAGTEYTLHRERTSYETSRIEFTAPPPPKAVETEPEPEPVPEPVEEPPPPKEAPKKVRAPRPNTQTPPPPPKEAPKPVFGATADSVGNSQSGVSIRVGNTLEGEMDKAPPPKKVTPLAPPPEEPATPVQKTEPKEKPVPVYNLSRAPKFKTRVEPVYPAAARKAEVEGVVQLEVLIDRNGRVKDVKVLKTPGGGLDAAAVAALNKSRFEPGMMNGKPVPVKIKIPYRFILDS
jgi:periplasmic protein TonB